MCFMSFVIFYHLWHNLFSKYFYLSLPLPLPLSPPAPCDQGDISVERLAETNVATGPNKTHKLVSGLRLSLGPF